MPFVSKNSGTGRSPTFAPGTPHPFFQLWPKEGSNISLQCLAPGKSKSWVECAKYEAPEKFINDGDININITPNDRVGLICRANNEGGHW